MWTTDNDGDLINLQMVRRIYIQQRTDTFYILLADISDTCDAILANGSEQNCVEKRSELLRSLLSKGE